VKADRIVLVHGFTQTARSWRPTVARLTAALGPDVEIVALDAPGHGDRADVRADLPTSASMLGVEGGRATYVGYSMGGRLCLHLALASPHLVDRLVLISATPGIEDDRERDARRAADDALADEIERIGVGAFLERWLAQPLFSQLDPADGDIEARPTWKPMHRQPLYCDARAVLTGEADRIFDTGLCLPSGSSLSDADQGRVLEIVESVLRHP
jgi:2-succinyl-6-hydroxy-2,4-cyclohexadiene-1-carboxylate synthase